MPKNILMITDNRHLLVRFKPIASSLKAEGAKVEGIRFDYRCSANNKEIQKTDDILPIDVNNEVGHIVSNYDLVMSLHCKQIFPAELVRAVRCVNVHPGYNPYNRGWFPHVFSLLNKKPVGVTIHEMDDQLDHGPIIVQEQVPLYEWDTSQTVYERILDKEMELVEKYLMRIINADYHTKRTSIEGNVNYRKDYESLCKLDLEEVGTLGHFVDRLRALTHGGYQNGYFEDEQGRKVYVSITLEPEPGDGQT